MIKILQGSVVTQTVLGGLTIYPPVVTTFGFCLAILNIWIFSVEALSLSVLPQVL